MARRVMNVNGVDVSMPESTTVREVLAEVVPDSKQAIVHRRDGAIEVRPVDALDRLDPDLVHHIRTNQKDIQQG